MPAAEFFGKIQVDQYSYNAIFLRIGYSNIPLLGLSRLVVS